MIRTVSEKELENIYGGGRAINTLGGLLSGATFGVKLCSPGGPWAVAGCGITGAIIGGVWGYNA